MGVEKSMLLLKAEARADPAVFLICVSTFRSEVPSGTGDGITVTIFDLISMVRLSPVESQTKPSASCPASTGSENTRSMLLLPSLVIIMSITRKSPRAGIVMEAFPFRLTFPGDPSH